MDYASLRWGQTRAPTCVCHYQRAMIPGYSQVTAAVLASIHGPLGDILLRLDIVGARVQPTDDTLTVLVIETMSRGFASPMATRKTDRY